MGGGRGALEIWDGNVQKLGCDDGCISINIIKFIELLKRETVLSNRSYGESKIHRILIQT